MENVLDITLRNTQYYLSSISQDTIIHNLLPTMNSV